MRPITLCCTLSVLAAALQTVSSELRYLREASINDHRSSSEQLLRTRKVLEDATPKTTGPNGVLSRVSYYPCSSNVVMFDTLVFVEFDGNLAALTEDERSAIEHGFMSAYNNKEVCDPFFRSIVDVRLEVPQLQFTQYAANSSATTQQPTVTAHQDTIASIASFFVVARCHGCSVNASLFATNYSSNMPLPPGSDNFLTASKSGQELDACSCPADASSFRAPEPEEFLAAFNSTMADAEADGYLYGVGKLTDLVEVDEVECSPDPVPFSSNVFVNLQGNPELMTAEEKTALEKNFLDTYNRLTFLRCDSYFRQILGVELIIIPPRTTRRLVGVQELYTVDPVNGTNVSHPLNGTYDFNSTHAQNATNSTTVTNSKGTVPAVYRVYGQCRGCQSTPTGSFELFDDVFQRHLASVELLPMPAFMPSPSMPESQVCICPVNNAEQDGRGPSEEEFKDAYNSNVEELQSQGVLVNVDTIKDIADDEDVCSVELEEETGYYVVGFTGLVDDGPNVDKGLIEAFKEAYGLLGSGICGPLLSDVKIVSIDPEVMRVTFYITSLQSFSGSIFQDGEAKAFLSALNQNLPRNVEAQSVMKVNEPNQRSFESLAPSTDEPKTAAPTPVPTATEYPKSSSAPQPTVKPTRPPSPNPTAAPTRSPTPGPTASPTPIPTSLPTPNPTKEPTRPPTPVPTRTPSSSPTSSPTPKPTTTPSHSPTLEPTLSPSLPPSVAPSVSPTLSPTTLAPTKPLLEQKVSENVHETLESLIGHALEFITDPLQLLAQIDSVLQSLLESPLSNLLGLPALLERLEMELEELTGLTSIGDVRGLLKSINGSLDNIWYELRMISLDDGGGDEILSTVTDIADEILNTLENILGTPLPSTDNLMDLLQFVQDTLNELGAGELSVLPNLSKLLEELDFELDGLAGATIATLPELTNVFAEIHGNIQGLLKSFSPGDAVPSVSGIIDGIIGTVESIIGSPINAPFGDLPGLLDTVNKALQDFIATSPPSLQDLPTLLGELDIELAELGNIALPSLPEIEPLIEGIGGSIATIQGWFIPAEDGSGTVAQAMDDIRQTVEEIFGSPLPSLPDDIPSFLNEIGSIVDQLLGSSVLPRPDLSIPQLGEMLQTLEVELSDLSPVVEVTDVVGDIQNNIEKIISNLPFFGATDEAEGGEEISLVTGIVESIRDTISQIVGSPPSSPQDLPNLLDEVDTILEAIDESVVPPQPDLPDILDDLDNELNDLPLLPEVDGVVKKIQQRVDDLLSKLPRFGFGVFEMAPDPTGQPTLPPSSPPTNSPTPIPTNSPTPIPTNSPTPIPTNSPTPIPTNSPTLVPTRAPTISPTLVPTTKSPTNSPTGEPTPIPSTSSPTMAPTIVPTTTPTTEST